MFISADSKVAAAMPKDIITRFNSLEVCIQAHGWLGKILDSTIVITDSCCIHAMLNRLKDDDQLFDIEFDEIVLTPEGHLTAVRAICWKPQPVSDELVKGVIVLPNDESALHFARDAATQRVNKI